MERVIDNEVESILDILDKLAAYKAERIRFATGFLFFEGWKHLRNVISKDIESFYLLFGFTDIKMAAAMAKTLEKGDMEYVFYKLAQKLSEEALEDVLGDEKLNLFIREKKLKIRWLEELHAKLYLFTRDEDDEINLDGRAILGSSNITERGLTRPGELNTFFDSSENIKKLLEWYKRNWTRGKPLNPEILLNSIINEDSRRKLVKSGEFIDIEEMRWNLIEAYLFLFWYLLGGVYDIEEIRKFIDKPTGELSLHKHNEEAVLWGYQILEKYGGVILADPVGTGKSFQALGILAFLRARKNIKNVLFIAPPHLIRSTGDSPSHWEKYIKNFFREVESMGSIPEISLSKILKCRDKNGNFTITLASSYGLSLLLNNENAKKNLANYDVIVIDEAHHFKNIEAKKRLVLNDIIREHRRLYGDNPPTILLTATPIINDVAEILALMSIYTQGDTGDFDTLARLELERDIIRKFEKYQETTNALKKEDIDKDKRRKLEKERREALDEIRSFLKGAIVMRSRAYIEKKFERAKAPRPKLRNLSYDFYKEIELVKLINNLRLSYLELAPSTILFIKKMSVRSGKPKLDMEAEMITLQGIMKILLAKRLESSVYAFLSTLSRIRETMSYTLKLLQEETNAMEIAKLLYAKKIGEIQGEDISETERLSALGIYETDEEAKKSIDNIYLRVEEILSRPDKLMEIIKGIKEDLQMIDTILQMRDINDISREYNSKDKLIVDFVKKKMEERKKIVIYSMYVDTIEWLEELLKTSGIEEDKIFKVTGKTKGKDGIILNFEEMQDAGVMLSTDALSEGVNLAFVDELVNYDIPWTPSTLMQRVGRLWRSGRRKEILFYTILPPKELMNSFSSVIEKVEEKLGKIRDVLIQEIKLLKEEEELSENFEDRVYGNLYAGDYEFKEFMEELKGESEMLEAKLIEFINTEYVDGDLLKDLIKEKEKEYNIAKKMIKDGKILNMAIEKNPYALVSFGKRYWFKWRGEVNILTDDNIWELLHRKWISVKKNPEQPIRWIDNKNRSFKKSVIENAFRNYFKEFLINVIKKRKGLDWEIMNALLQMSVETSLDDELRKLKSEVFLLLSYYFYNRKRSSKRSEAIKILKELGFIDKNRNLNIGKFNNKKALKELEERLKGDVEKIGIEVLL